MAILQWRYKDKEDYTWTEWFDSREFVAFNHSLPELVAIEVRIKPDFVFVPGYYKYVGRGGCRKQIPSLLRAHGRRWIRLRRSVRTGLPAVRSDSRH